MHAQVIYELLKVKGLLPELAPSRNALMVACLGEELRPTAMAAAAAVREAGTAVDVVLEAKKPKWVFKHADRMGVGYVAIFGPREAEQGLVRVKDLTVGEQVDVPIAELPAWMSAKAGGADEA